MSISKQMKVRINFLVARKKLFLLQPLDVGSERVRKMFVSEEVLEDITPPFADNFDGIRLGEFRARLEQFIVGDTFSIAEDPRNKPSDAMLARVEPVTDEIWDIRCVDPNPGIRCLGAFAGKDTFIALTWDYRENFDGNWMNEIQYCKTTWKTLFGSINRFKGSNLDDYFSENYFPV